MEEIWKDIEGYEGFYQVSNFGNVKSLNFQGRGYQQNLALKKNCKGYYWVMLYKFGSKQPLLVHRLVANAFIQNPNNYKHVNHKDENPLNNNMENLEWCTASYNVRYSLERHPERSRRGVPRGPYKGGMYKGCKRTQMKIVQFTMDGEFVKEWENSVTIKRVTGMSDWSISECCRGKRKQAYGFKWHYAT